MAVFTAFLTLSAGLVSCSKKDATPDLSIAFERVSYSIPQSGEVVMKLVATAPLPTETSIPFTLTGDAVKGTDYEIAAESFVFAAGTNVAEVKVNVKPSFDKTKSLKAALGALPYGIRLGNIQFTEVSIEAKDVILYSFEYQNQTMTATAEITMTLESGAGSYIPDKEIRIPVVLAEGTTAVEGRNFSFAGPKEFVIPVGKSKGTITLNLIKQEAGKDIIVLKPAALNNHFAAGNFAKTKISIFGSSYDKLKGTWKYKGFTNFSWLVDNTSFYNDDPAAFPSKNTDQDLLIFSDAGLKVQMTGDVKNYFRDATVTNLGEITERLQEAPGFPPPRVKIQLVKLSALNVSFSATKPKVRAGELGLRVFMDGTKEILEVTVRDYEPTDFLTNTYLDFINYGDIPIMATMPIRYQFERVIEK